MPTQNNDKTEQILTRIDDIILLLDELIANERTAGRMTLLQAARHHYLAGAAYLRRGRMDEAGIHLETASRMTTEIRKQIRGLMA